MADDGFTGSNIITFDSANHHDRLDTQLDAAHQGYYAEDGPLFTDQQATVLSYLHYISAPLSAVGSFVIIHSLLTTRQSNLRPPFRRIMLGISVNDLITSLTWIFMCPWASPRYQENFVSGAYGTFTSCSVMGFFLNFTLGACLYSAFLALYFVLQVRFEVKSETISRRWEPIFHLLAILVPLVSGLYATISENMNPISTAPGTCWLRPYPARCNINDDVECTRGGDGNNAVLSRVLGTGSVALSFVIIMVSMCLLVVKVLQTERRMNQYGARASLRTMSNLKRTRACTIQALCYVLAFFVSFFPLVLAQLKLDIAENRSYFLVVSSMFKILNPLLGFSNCLVYLKKSGAELTIDASCLWALCCQRRIQDSFDDGSEPPKSLLRRSKSLPGRVWANLTEESTQHFGTTTVTSVSGHPESNTQLPISNSQLVNAPEVEDEDAPENETNDKLEKAWSLRDFQRDSFLYGSTSTKPTYHDSGSTFILTSPEDGDRPEGLEDGEKGEAKKSEGNEESSADANCLEGQEQEGNDDPPVCGERQDLEEGTA